MKWPSVAWGLENLSSRELVEWKAYFELEPFGFERDDYRTALSTMFITNALIGLLGGKKSKQLDFDKFLLVFGERKAGELSSDHLLRKAEAMNAAFGGIDLRKK